jgi:hypothetical protein
VTAEHPPQVRVVDATSRMGQGPHGFGVSVEYIVEGEPGTQTEWLGEFLEQHAPAVVVPSD